MGKVILEIVRFILTATVSFGVGAVGSSFGEACLYTIKYLFVKDFKQEEERKAKIERLEAERRINYWSVRAEKMQSESGETIAGMIAEDMLFEPDLADEFVEKYPDKLLYRILEDPDLRTQFINVYIREKNRMKKA